MKARLFAACAGVLLSAPSAFAQSLAGIALGDSEAKAIKGIPEATAVDIDNDPNHRLIYGGDLMAWVCKGKVYSIHRQADGTLTDYLARAKKERTTRGEPEVSSSVDGDQRTARSQLVSKWTGKTTVLLLALLYDGEKHQVMTSLTGDSSCN